MDEAMLDGRGPGKRCWRAARKHIVFVIYQRNGKVLTFPISSRDKDSIIPLITHYTKADSLYYTDDLFVHTSLSISGNYVVVTENERLPKGHDHLNSIEGFYSYAKHWLYQYCGVYK